MQLDVQLVCLAQSNTTVLVTLATVKHGNIEFGFSKACLAPTKVRSRPHPGSLARCSSISLSTLTSRPTRCLPQITESGFLRTSSSLFKVVFALVAVVGITAFVGLRKYSAQYLSGRSMYGSVPQQQ